MLGQGKVVGGLALAVGVARDLEIHVGEVLQDLEGSVENRKRSGQDFRRGGLEVDAFDDPGELLDLRRDLVGATLLVLVVVEGLGLVGALVDLVGDAVSVVVGIGATVLILEAIEVLGLVGTLVELVRDAVSVVVGVGAAVFVLEAVLVLGLVGALVERIGDAVAVVVEIGAAVVVLEAVLVLGLVGALVDVVGDARAVVVEIGAAVVVLEAVLVLGFVGTLVHVVGDAVAVLVGPDLGSPLADSLAVVDVDPLDFADVQVHAAEDLEVRAGVADAIAMGDNGQRGPRHGNAPVEADAHHGRKADLEANAGVHERLGASASLGRVADERRQPTISSEQEGLEPVVVVQIQNETAPVGEDVHLRAEIAEVRLVVAGSGRYDGELSLEADPAVEVQAEFPAEHARARGRPGRRISHGPP